LGFYDQHFMGKAVEHFPCAVALNAERGQAPLSPHRPVQVWRSANSA